MKKRWFAFRILAVTGLLTVSTLAAPRQKEQNAEAKKPTFKAVSFSGCRWASWEPEVFSFYGDPATVRAKLKNFEMHLADRRVFMFLVESSQSAQLSLFELAKDKDDKDSQDTKSKDTDKFHVWIWGGKSAAELREKATDTILANRGVLCVGEQVKGLVKALQPEDKGVVPAPKTALAAFGHAIKGYNDQYIRLTVFLLC
jgi:hypothetical protein